MRHLSVLTALTLAAAAVATAAPTTIRCPAEPPQIRTYNLVERWRIDADDPDAPLIGLINWVTTPAPGGDLYLLDRQLCHVLVYGPGGEHRTTLSREGEGPGELRQPGRVYALPDGTIGVTTGYPTSLVCFDIDGVPTGSWKPESAANLGRIEPYGNGWIAIGNVTNHERQDPRATWMDSFLAAFDGEGALVRDYRRIETCYVHDPPTRDERQPYLSYNGWDLTQDGHLIVATERDLYHLEIIDPKDGTTVGVIDRDLETYRRTDEDKQEIRDRQRLIVNGVRQEIEFHLLDTEPLIQSLTCQLDGTIRVGTCWSTTDLPEGVALRYDLLEPDGRLREEVHLVGPYDADYDAIRILGDGRAIILRNYSATSSAMYNMLDDDDPVREDEAFAVVVCDLVPVE